MRVQAERFIIIMQQKTAFLHFIYHPTVDNKLMDKLPDHKVNF